MFPDFKRIEVIWVTVSDVKKAVDFYTGILGLKQTWLHTHGAGIVIGEGPMIILSNEENPDKDVMFNFFTPDITKAHQLLKSNGVEVSEIEYLGKMPKFYFKDQDGNKLMAVSNNIE